jgi:hypothetical protein
MGDERGAGAPASPDAAARAIQVRNWRLVQADSIFIGIVNASSTFLPVFLLRLGASANDVGLLTALPALTAFLLAIPLGRMLQARGRIVAWYSRLRMVAWASYAVIAAAVALLPREQSVGIALAIWALASLPSTAALVAFPMVMDGAAGPGGRFDLLGRRWAIAGVSSIVAVALGGQFLAAVPFPLNYEVLLVIITLGGFGSFLQSSRLQVADHIARPRAALPPRRERLRELWRLVVSNRPFVGYELRTLAYITSLGLALPVLPLFYVQDLAASDAWIGIIGAAGSAGSVLGYVGLRQVGRRRGGSSILLPALVAAASTTLVLSFVGWLPAVAAIAFVAGLAGAGAQLALFDAMMRTFPRELGVTFSSVDQSIQNFAFIVAPNIGGFLAVALGSRQALLVTASVGFVAVALFARQARRTRGGPGGREGGSRLAERIGRDRAIGYDTKTMDDMQKAGGWPGTR